tara:strand:+ start:209 stop:712 length:504 start_codon:yes stop_codon:yes gene_type:complete
MADSIEMYSTGKGYVQSAFSMMDNPGRMLLKDDTSLFLGFHMLLGFATELYLKSYLLTVGMTEKQLRSAALRHDLEALWQEADARGFHDKSVYPLISYLHTGHKNFEFRYMSRLTTYNIPPDLNILFNWLTQLDIATDTASGASASKGRVPGSGWIFSLVIAKWRLP